MILQTAIADLCSETSEISNESVVAQCSGCAIQRSTRSQPCFRTDKDGTMSFRWNLTKMASWVCLEKSARMSQMQNTQSGNADAAAERNGITSSRTSKYFLI
jgi:hypothetical protein